jgi:hypothetical protein
MVVCNGWSLWHVHSLPAAGSFWSQYVGEGHETAASAAIQAFNALQPSVFGSVNYSELCSPPQPSHLPFFADIADLLTC